MEITELFDLDIGEASLVDAGANQLSKVSFWKRRSKTGGSAMSTFEEAVSSLPDDVQKALRAWKTAQDAKHQEDISTVTKSLGDRLDALTAKLEESSKTPEPVAKTEPIEGGEGLDVDALTEQIRKKLEAEGAAEKAESAKVIKALETQVATERSIRRRAEFAKRVDDEFSEIAVDRDAMAGFLQKSFEALDTEDFEFLTGLLSSSNERVSKSNVILLEERGTSQSPSEGSAVARAQSIAKRLQGEAKERGENLSYMEAEAQAYEIEPGLYEDYLNETRRAQRDA